MRALLLFAATLLMLNALRILPLVLVSIMLGLSPLIAAVLCHFILREKLTLAQVVCLLISFAGLSMIVMGASTPKEDSPIEYSQI